MKKITFNDIEYFYESYNIYGDEYTLFYSVTDYKKTVYKKYLFFGEFIYKYKHKELFKVWIDIENPNYSKEYVKLQIEKQISIYNRQQEINNGIII